MASQTCQKYKTIPLSFEKHLLLVEKNKLPCEKIYLLGEKKKLFVSFKHYDREKKSLVEKCCTIVEKQPYEREIMLTL